MLICDSEKTRFGGFFPQKKIVLFQIDLPVEGTESKHSWILSKGF